MKAKSIPAVTPAAAATSACLSGSSSGEVEAGELRYAAVTVSAPGEAGAGAFATGAATIKASSGADVTIAGKPATQDGSNSSGGSVSFSG